MRWRRRGFEPGLHVKVLRSGFARAGREGESCDDAWAMVEGRGAIVAALADGMGSAREGGAAARRAVEMLTDHGVARPRAWSPRRALAEITAQINRQLHQEAMERHGTPERVCTLSAAVIEGGWLYGCNVGDSPVFLWRGGKLRRLSTLHVLDEPEMQHVLTRAIGLEAQVEPEFFEVELANGDVVLLCSDGVTASLDETRLSELLARGVTARSVVLEAHARALEGKQICDDASAIVLEIEDRGWPAGADAQRLEVAGTLRKEDAVDGYTLVRALDPHERVWLANAGDGGSVVLKFPPRDAAETEALRDAFVREAWNATRVGTSDFVRAWTQTEGPLRFYAMEYVQAPTLRDELRAGLLAVEDARELGRFLVRSAQTLLRHGLAHGDIKPENILVLRSAEGAGTSVTFKLLDFGSAAEVFSVTSRAGTPSYLAPERFRGAAIAERTELYAIGVTLYEALTGGYPYGEVERFQTPRFDTPPKRLTKINPAVPAWLEAIVLRAVEPDPERRYQVLSEMAFDLDNPEKVAPHHRKDASLIERNPVRFYQGLCVVLTAIIVGLLWKLAGE